MPQLGREKRIWIYLPPACSEDENKRFPVLYMQDGQYHHVTSRGDRREAIYLPEADRQEWLKIAGNVCERYNWVCHAYCEMTNHYHLVVETPEANLLR